jgi:hypothetical protein
MGKKLTLGQKPRGPSVAIFETLPHGTHRF